MAESDDLTPRELKALVHANAAKLREANDLLTPGQAIRQAADLVVLAYDDTHLARVLRDAAASQKVPPMLANLITPIGGATLALAADVGLGEDAP